MTNSSKVKVSVCIPVYGVEKYIERCARSLFEQTMKDGIEFIFVNDCTKDKSIEILEQILSEYPGRREQVKIIHHEKNGGLVAARKTALAHVVGDYVIHCDSDDWVELNMYETMYNKAIETNADIVYCDYYISTENKRNIIKHFGKCVSKMVIDEIFSGIAWGGVWNILSSRKIALAVELYCPNHIIMHEDILRISQMIMICDKISFVNKPLYYYFQNETSIVHRFNKEKLENIMEVTDFLIEKFYHSLPSEVIKRKKLSMLDILVVHSDLSSISSFKKYSKDITLSDYIQHFALNGKFNKRAIFTLISHFNFSLGCWSYRLAEYFYTLFSNHETY